MVLEEGPGAGPASDSGELGLRLVLGAGSGAVGEAPGEGALRGTEGPASATSRRSDVDSFFSSRPLACFRILHNKQKRRRYSSASFALKTPLPHLISDCRASK